MAIGGFAGAGLSMALVSAPQALALAANAGIVNTAAGQVSVLCETPTPAGVETTPTASSGGVTLPTVPLPSVTLPSVTVPGQKVPSVTVGQVQVGPFTIGPESTPPVTSPTVVTPSITVGGGTVGGETIGGASNGDTVQGAGVTACTGVNITNPADFNMLSGFSHLVVQWQEVDSSGGIHFASSQPHQTPLIDTPLACLPNGIAGNLLGAMVLCPNGVPAIGGDLAAGTDSQSWTGVPAAGQIDRITGWTSTGVGDVYFGASVYVSGVAQAQGPQCLYGDYTCNTSGTFLVE